jgi:hypothetical protein
MVCRVGSSCESTWFQLVTQVGGTSTTAHVLLNLAIGGQWAGRYGIDDAAFPQALAVDWVRVYRKRP